ncbi:hypothetical protein FXB78_05390 [Aggregatibacter actinomycetemcomitans]|nr:hypothetical protein FXN58_04570 [Aggregatibacter actinomycetemcomitans]QEH47000.1 hypothetical protein FXN59_04680 [Aggregatibacter actinomycetemcomitans]TYA48697.1 hypothetical protein FXB74_08670 [Aggregatibacter actinomycetemcomitans]TYA51466.1 hypothetical protein FXB81_03755 [Aggregatibacter actinomycetemcomitans]TYB29232.1 hypothetical protein FXB78_05390 [Aggregatibacter actinomycetemcomitans]
MSSFGVKVRLVFKMFFIFLSPACGRETDENCIQQFLSERGGYELYFPSPSENPSDFLHPILASLAPSGSLAEPTLKCKHLSRKRARGK